MTIDRKSLLDAALAGYDTPLAAALYLFPPPEGTTVDSDIVARITKILLTTDFNTEFQRAKEDVVGSAVASIRRTVMENVLEVKELAKTATDPRVRLAANKDLLDRAGLAATQKTVAYSPSDYFKLVEGLQPQERANDEKSVAPEDPESGVVQKDQLPPPEGSAGS